jgi:hypothetical protein
VLVGSVNTSDDGGLQSIMFTSGVSEACCGAPQVYGAAGNVLVDWVREWGTQPSNIASPSLIDTTLLNNYEQGDVVQASAGSGTSGPTSYTYQFQDCTGISGTGCTDIGTSPQCANTTATICNYTLAPSDVGDYIVVSVTATDSSGTSSSAASAAAGPIVASRINQACTNTRALTDIINGPHLCGWPDATNVGYLHAPGFNGESTGGGYPVNPTPGSLTTASAGSQTCPTTPVSNQSYSFCKYNFLNVPSNLTNVRSMVTLSSGVTTAIPHVAHSIRP